MDFNYPSIDIPLTSELNNLLTEFNEIKLKDLLFREKIIKEINEQNKKIEIIHNLFNSYKEDSKQPYNADTVLNDILKTDKMKLVSENLYNIHDLHTYNIHKQENIINLDKFINLNKTVIDKYKEYENIILTFKINISKLEKDKELTHYRLTKLENRLNNY